MQLRLPRRPKASVEPDRGETPAQEELTPRDQEAMEDPDLLEEAQDSPPEVAPVVVPRWIQLVILPLGLLALWGLARAMGSLLVVLIAAGVIALILNPLAKHFQRWMPRGLAIVCSYLVILVVFAAIIGGLSAPVASQVSYFASHLPSLVRKGNSELTSIQNVLNKHGLHVHLAKQGSSALDTLEKKLEKSSGKIVSTSTDVLGKLVSFTAQLVLTFVLSVYLLVYARPIGEIARRWMPPGDGTHTDDYPLLVQRAVSSYVRGQLLFSLVMGASAAIICWILGLANLFPDASKYAVFFGLFYGLMELIPYVGPILGPIPPILVALFTHPLSALWTLIAFVILQQLEGHIVAPQIFRISLRINPILVILALLVGYKLFGIVGALIALPMATVLRATILYLRKHLVLEQWSASSPPL